MVKNGYCKRRLNCVLCIALYVINQQCIFQGINNVTLAYDVSAFTFYSVTRYVLTSWSSQSKTYLHKKEYKSHLADPCDYMLIQRELLTKLDVTVTINLYMPFDQNDQTVTLKTACSLHKKDCPIFDWLNNNIPP